MTNKHTNTTQDGDREFAGIVVLIVIVILSLILGLIIGLNIS